METPPEEPRNQYATSKGEIKLRDHEYDGIQEYDQLLPNWWLTIFFASLIFSIGYWLAYYQFGSMQTDAEKINSAMAKIEDAKAKALEQTLAKLNNDVLTNQWAKDPERVSAGLQIYSTYCVGCHGQDLHARIQLAGGQSVALPGLSLKDGEWKYGPNPMDQFGLILNGTPPDNTGHNGAKMEAWGQKISPLQVAEVTAYLISENPNDFMK